ncbi:MAG: PAS domain S-box protein [Pyrinomonadaceae bacterium]|nr:PAS domain S-box protein [Pyrinomonadaceae bacterium]
MEERSFLPKHLSLAQKLQTIIVGRLMVVFLLLVSSWVWHSGQLRLSYENFPRDLFIVFVIAVGLTIVYFFLTRLSTNYAWQIRIQFLLDILLTTWLVWRTGDVTSPYITLYIVLISVASVFLSGRGTILVSVLCVALFSALSIATSFSLIESLGVLPDSSKIAQIVGFHSVAFLVVGLLSARLAGRYAQNEKLRETTKTLANLRVLHERIVESVRSGLITIDLEGTIYTFNKTAEEITGRNAGEMRGSSIFELLGDIRGQIAEAMESEEDSNFRHEIGFTTPDGFVVQLGYGISPLFSEDGEKTGLIVTFQDLTDIRSMEESVRRKDRLAAVGRVAAGLAHEIRNPLGAMRGAIQILESKTEKNSDQANLMDIILRESDRLNEIITNFLKYARPRIGNFAEVDVKEAITDTITLLRHSPDVKEDIELTAEMPKDNVLMNADVSQLKQIFWNLARNSMQALEGKGRFSIRLSQLNTNRIRIEFSDNGCGMPPEQVEQLFEPFSKSTTGGTGLGLSIVYQIVRDHNGTINITSKEYAGTKITIELPTDYVRAGGTDENRPVEAEDPDLVLKNYVTVNEEQNKISS